MIRLLLVDNNAVFLEAFARLLKRPPDTEVVAQATSLAEARRKLSSVDVAIFERRLPDGDGLELISEVREASPGAAVLVMTSCGCARSKLTPLEAGADGILDKIASPEETMSAVRRVGEG